MRSNRKIFSLIILSFLLVLAACGSESSSEVSEEEGASEGTSGGELRVAINTQPPTLDTLLNQSVSTRDVTRLIFETLYTIDSEFNPVPMLAESVETDDDNRVFTFKLREGVNFSNGEEMTSEDVVASMNRWAEMSTVIGDVFEGATFEEEGDYTVVLTLAEPSPLVLDLVASPKQAPYIMPKEIVDATPEEGLEEYVGTGPFKFVAWQQDQYIHVTKNEEYQPVEGEPDGLAGKREALVDDVIFEIVTDSSTRLAGLQTGEYDVIYGVPEDNYEQVKNDSTLEAHPDANGELYYFYNTNEGIASDPKIRQAINAALDIDSIMEAAYANEELYWLHSGYMHKNISNWASEAGNEFYNMNDPEKAKEMLEEAGYNGEEYRIMATRDYPAFYNAAIVIQDRLMDIGVNVTLDVYDWPTLSEHARDMGAWDSLVASASLVTTPNQLLVLSDSFAGGMIDDTIGEMLSKVETNPSQEDAKMIWDELQAYAWEEYVPVTTLGGFNDVYGVNDNVDGFNAFNGPILWNTTVEE